MKRFRMALLAAVVASAFTFTGCDKDDDDDNNNSNKTYELSGNANGSQMEPATSSSGTGTISGTYNSNTNVMSYTIVWTNLESAPTTAGFFSKVTGQSDITIGAALNLGSSPAAASGSTTGSITLSADEEAKLLANQWYYVVRTATNINGEIRGNVSATAKN